MSKLDELIKEYCPNGVEYKPLSEAFIQFSGMGGVSNKWADEGNCLFIDYMNAYTNISIDVTALKNATVKTLTKTPSNKETFYLQVRQKRPMNVQFHQLLKKKSLFFRW